MCLVVGLGSVSVSLITNPRDYGGVGPVLSCGSLFSLSRALDIQFPLLFLTLNYQRNWKQILMKFGTGKKCKFGGTLTYRAKYLKIAFLHAFRMRELKEVLVLLTWT